MDNDNVFATLNAIDCNEHTEKKKTEWTDKKGVKHEMELTYLSWAWAWAEVKKAYPDAFYTIYENMDGWFYHTDGRTCWVKTGVTIEGLEHVEYLPVMDARNKSIPLESVTSFDVNKAIQRSLTKACARHGLGLYIYAGEDLPEDEANAPETKVEVSVKAPTPVKKPKAAKAQEPMKDNRKPWKDNAPIDAVCDWLYKHQQQGEEPKATLLANYKIDDVTMEKVLEAYYQWRINNNK